ncbi:hypothetical protein AB0C38_30015 [Amycolatopsis sp. NPDC048633]|uniref:hypothetical protein n=1 Tax=Amycolatopsis sp. NPDC048633 TaxID=3157095 RepID=UPI00340116FF
MQGRRQLSPDLEVVVNAAGGNTGFGADRGPGLEGVLAAWGRATSPKRRTSR